MITVLHLITGLSAHGAETMLYKLVARSDRARFRHVVVSLTDTGTLGEGIEALGIPLHTLMMRRGIPDPTAMVRLLALLRRVSPDVVQTWLYHADLLGLLTAKLAGRRVVVWNIRASNMDMSRYGRLAAWTRRACAWLSRRPRAVIVNSEAGRAFHARIGYHPREWILIPNGIDTERFRPDTAARSSVRQELGLEPETPLIGMVARFDPMKDHRTFLRAASLLHRQHPELHFLCVGRGVTAADDALWNAIKAESVRDNMHLLGERQDIPRLTAALDIATSASAFGEGFPNVVGEAMACAVPCVVTDVGDSASIVDDTGCVIPPEAPQALTTAWEELLALGAEGRQALGQRARGRAQTLFAFDQMVRQYEEVYERLAL